MYIILYIYSVRIHRHATVLRKGHRALKTVVLTFQTSKTRTYKSEIKELAVHAQSISLNGVHPVCRPQPEAFMPWMPHSPRAAACTLNA